MKINIFTIFLICFLCSFSCADTVITSDGTTFEGRVLNGVSENIVKLELVDEGKLIGAIIELDISQVKEVIKNEDYRNLQREELTEEEVQENLKRYHERRKSSLEYTESQWDRVYKFKSLRQEKHLRFAEFEHELEKIKLIHENRKDLITHSKENFIHPSVSIVDKQDNSSGVKSLKSLLE